MLNKFAFYAQTILIAVALLIWTLPAQAGGSASLEDAVTNLAGQAPRLMSEIHDALKNNKKKISDITCSATRLGRHWVHLGAARIPTYACPIGKKTVLIHGTVIFYDDAGDDTNENPKTSKYISMTSVSWNWK